MSQAGYARGHGTKRSTKNRSGGEGRRKERKRLLLTAGNLSDALKWFRVNCHVNCHMRTNHYQFQTAYANVDRVYKTLLPKPNYHLKQTEYSSKSFSSQKSIQINNTFTFRNKKRSILLRAYTHTYNFSAFVTFRGLALYREKLSGCTRKNDEFNSLAKMTNSINCTKFRNN